ncbi:MAG: adenosine deaminase [Patescibacteria group bacterium]
MDNFPTYPLAELHAHISASTSPATYWQIAHDQGIKLPRKDYFDFVDYISLSQNKKMTLEAYLKKIMHPILDKLGSGTYALERSMYEIMSSAYRRNNITLIEIRNNPMRHNNNGEHDLDLIILAMIRGMERALLEYPKLSAGIIFCLAREFPFEKNAIIIEKAIKYHKRGIVGIDFSGGTNHKSFQLKEYKELIQKARRAGLKITTHSGEHIKDDFDNDMWEALEFLQPQRIGHGIRAAYDPDLMKELVKQNTVLEVCPVSNLMTKAIENKDELKFILKTFLENRVRFTINSDWPEMLEGGRLRDQYKMLRDEKVLTADELLECTRTAFASAFAPKGGLDAYL